MALLHIMIAHLIGDFVLQPKILIEKKYKSWTGTLIHASIIGLMMALFLFPFWQHFYTWFLIAVVAVTHFAQDVSKVNYNKKFNKKNSTVPYLLDQFFHLLLLFLLGKRLYLLPASSLPLWVKEVYFSPVAVLTVMGLLLVTFVWDITLYQFKLKKRKHLKYSPHYRNMLNRGLLFSLATLILVLSFA